MLNFCLAPLFYSMLLVFLLIDLCAWHLCAFPIVQLVWCLFSVALFSHSTITRLCITFTVLCMELFISIGSSGESTALLMSSVLWIVPFLTFINHSLEFFPYAFSVSSLLIFRTFCQPLWLIESTLVVYTIAQIFVTLISVRILLKYRST